jgi:hypothetical protein
MQNMQLSSFAVILMLLGSAAAQSPGSIKPALAHPSAIFISIFYFHSAYFNHSGTNHTGVCEQSALQFAAKNSPRAGS